MCWGSFPSIFRAGLSSPAPGNIGVDSQASSNSVWSHLAADGGPINSKMELNL
jgi:hypothetical protein